MAGLLPDRTDLLFPLANPQTAHFFRSLPSLFKYCFPKEDFPATLPKIASLPFSATLHVRAPVGSCIP